MTIAKLTLVILGLLVVTVVPLFAHHSFAAEFDINAPITLTGVVTKIEWINPHVFFYMDVRDQTGTVVSWTCQIGSPSALLDRGWKRESLKAGDSITVRAYRARSGANFANARLVELADGRSVFGGSSGDFGPDR